MKNTKSSGNGTSKSNVKVSSKTKQDSTSGLKKLFVDELKDIYWAEKALTKALPKVIKKVSSDELRETIQNHLDETEEQVTRLEKVFENLGIPAVGKKCDAMTGLIKETDTIIAETEEGPVRDAGIISAAQKIEHYEIATYGTLCSFAKILGEVKSETLLHDTLLEEKGADEKLTDLAESVINADALQEQDEE